MTGFKTEHRQFGEQVVETGQFGDGASAVDSGDSHGTATAATVAHIAPDADIYVGTFESADDYEDGLTWMADNNVDIVIAPVFHVGTFGDGVSSISAATTNAVEDGMVVVAPTGNIATGHWVEEYAPTEDGVHQFDNGPTNEIRGPTTAAEFWLTWDSDEEYSLELHRLVGNETERAATSEPYDNQTERLTTQIDGTDLAVVVSGPSTPSQTDIRVTSSTHTFADNRTVGSITAPAAADGVLAVGAIDSQTAEIEPFSSRGPTTDGRTGVDVVAPSFQLADEEPFIGTSAAASYVGGVAALVIDAGVDNPEAVTVVLTESATASEAEQGSSPPVRTPIRQ